MLKVVGGVIFALGIGLFVGNVSRLFPTIPLAGWATMAIGGVIYKAGNQ